MSIKKVQRTKVGQNRLNTKFKKIKKIQNKKSTLSIIKMIIYMILFFVISIFIFLMVFYSKYLQPLSVEKLKNYEIPEGSIVYDRNGKEMYKFYVENRTYVDYEHISKNIINALVAGEDKRYWDNPGVDFIGLIRAGLNSVISRSKAAGTSTLTQQLIRNTIITKKPNETTREGLDRKIKEIFLSYQLTKSISKEKILELYLNKIEFGHNAFGIEEASKRFFDKNAKDINIFEASVLASLPKGPSYYSPYNYPDRIVGYLHFTDSSVDENGKKIIKKFTTKEEIDSKKEMVDQLKNKISKLVGKEISEGSNKYMICGIEKNSLENGGKFKLSVDSDGCLVLDYDQISHFISEIEINSGDSTIFHYPGRKDYILGRMLEDGYINFIEYKEAVIEGFGYTFHRKKERIIAPHFVFYIKEYLEKKYGEDSLSTSGLKIYTTLDLDLQKKAEEIVSNQAKANSQKFAANNSALITIDNKTGGILAMVGNEDYFSENGKGNVNVITSKLQPGSSFKPFVYSLAMFKNELGTKTPVFDVETTFPGNYKPKNFDGKFMGKIDISTALNYSRNIPAIKMFFMTDGVKEIVDFMHKLGATSLAYNENYGASIALGTGEMTPLDLAKAYSVFANMGEKIEINPILKIVDSKGMIIEELKVKKERVMTTGQAFLINNILSDSSTRPSSRNNYLGIGRSAAVKTGTSTKPVKENGKDIQYPANLFTAGYTPQITTVVWSGNIDGKTMKYSGSGLEASAPIWRDFMKYYHNGKENLDWEKPDDVKKLTVSSINGLLPNPEGIHNFLVSSYFINPPKKIDNSYKIIEYDALCNGKITAETPEAARRKSIILQFHSLKPNNPDWENPVQAWANSEAVKQTYGTSSSVAVTDEVCKRTGNGGGNIVIKSSLLETKGYSIGANPIDIAFNSTNPIIKIEILLNGEIHQTIDALGKNTFGISQNIFIPQEYNNKKLKVEIRALDENYYSSSEIKEIFVGNLNQENNSTPENTVENTINSTSNENISDNSPLKINITNPKNSSIKLNREDYFNLRFNVNNKNSISSVNIFINDELFTSLGNSGDYVVPINQENTLKKGTHNLKIQVLTNSGEKKEEMLQINILN